MEERNLGNTKEMQLSEILIKVKSVTVLERLKFYLFQIMILFCTCLGKVLV